jgi:hypothetical protein
MYKLLTAEQEERVRKEYNTHRLIIILTMLIGVALTGLVGMFPSYILTMVREREVGVRAATIDMSESRKEETELRNWLVETNRNLTIMSPSLDIDKVTPIFYSVIALKPAGISLNTLNWTKIKSKVLININGVAKDRQTLISFEKAINGSGKFSEVVLPISNLAKDKDIDFKLTLSPI